MDLIIGDSLLKKPIVWYFSDIKLKFSEVEPDASEPFADFYKPKKLISVRKTFCSQIMWTIIEVLHLTLSMFIF